jgi:nucleoside-diphosphate-sugar epimerase
MDHVAVLGGLGFIGSHLVDALLAAGKRVLAIDSEVASVTDGSEFNGDGRCRVLRQSVEDYFERGGTLDGFDAVIHCASYVGPAGILQHAGKLGAHIVRTSDCIIEACLRSDVPLIVMSSAEVYGTSGLLREEQDIRVPVHYNARIEYALGKVLTESMTLNSRRRGLRGIVIRPFNVAGPRQSRFGGFVMPTFVQQALRGLPITVFHPGDQVRAFLAVSDFCRFFIEHGEAALAGGDTIFNLGNPENRITIRDLAHQVKSLLGSDSEIVSLDGKTVHGPDYEEAESFEKVPVLEAARRLGWAPRVDLAALIRETADHYRCHADERGQDAPL